MKIRRLKADAVPSFWPGLPSIPPPTPRPTKFARSDARQQNIEAMEMYREEAEKSIDSTSLLELKRKTIGIDLSVGTAEINEEKQILIPSNGVLAQASTPKHYCLC